MSIWQNSTTTKRTEAKQRYNETHYDQIKFYSPKGSREIIQQLAAASGQSMAEYIRTLVIRDADRHGIDVRAALGGGGADSTMIQIATAQLLGDWWDPKPARPGSPDDWIPRVK